MICFLCDYGLPLLAVAVVLLVAAWRFTAARELSPLPLETATPTSTIQAPSPTPTLNETVTVTPVGPTLTLEAALPPTATITQAPTQTVMPAASPTPELLEYVLAIIPVDWLGSQREFEVAARQHANLFISESGMDEFFRIQLEILPIERGMLGADLSSENLVYDIIQWGLGTIPADRYIGLTDGDISLYGISDIAGWTAGPDTLAVVGEAAAVSVTAHELGHTYGLCDEYSYSAWSQQNLEFLEGCPNPYPTDCPQDTMAGLCPGNPTQDGRFSMMGPAGMPGDYGFNTPCYEHLQSVFRELSGGTP